MSDADFEQFIEGCKIAFRCKFVTPKSGVPYYQVDLGRRREFFIFLFARLQERLNIKNVTVQDFLNPNKRAILIEECIAHGDRVTANKKRGWVKGTTKDINGALEYLFPEEFQTKTFDDVAVPKPEMYKSPLPEDTSKTVLSPDDPDYDWKSAPRWNPDKYQQETGEAPIEDILNPELAELLGYDKKK